MSLSCDMLDFFQEFADKRSCFVYDLACFGVIHNVVFDAFPHSASGRPMNTPYMCNRRSVKVRVMCVRCVCAHQSYLIPAGFTSPNSLNTRHPYPTQHVWISFASPTRMMFGIAYSEKGPHASLFDFWKILDHKSVWCGPSRFGG